VLGQSGASHRVEWIADERPPTKVLECDRDAITGQFTLHDFVAHCVGRGAWVTCRRNPDAHQCLERWMRRGATDGRRPAPDAKRVISACLCD
jgi:hypothetical protein